MRTPAALADRREFGERDVGTRIRRRVDHRRDDALGAEIERAARGREFADGNPHDRRRAALAHLRDRRQHRGGVPQAVLPSSVTAGKPSRPTSSATIGEGRPHQPLWTVSPARSRRASEKAGCVVMRKSSFAHRPRNGAARTGGGRSGHPEANLRSVIEFVAGASDAACALFAGFGFQDRLRHQFIHGAANLLIGLRDALGIEILRILRNTSSSPASSKSATTTSLA